MKKLLFIDATIRKNLSRTKFIAEYLLSNISKDKYSIEIIDLSSLKPLPLDYDALNERDKKIINKEFNDEAFRLANQFAKAFAIIVAAPFWDLSFPSILKVYFEHVSVSGITFTYGERGLVGLCKASDLVFVTTRGGIYKDSPLEQGSSYIEALTKVYGIPNYHCIASDGLDIEGFNVDDIINDALANCKIISSILNSR